MLRWGIKLLIPTVLCYLAGVWYVQTERTRPVPNLESDLFAASELREKVHTAEESSVPDVRIPTIYVGVLVRNKAHSLPYFLHGLEIQNYPSNRIAIHFICDNSVDNSESILREWVKHSKNSYHSVTLDIGSDDLTLTPMWSQQHYEHVINLKQKLLEAARQSWADFYLAIDADVILMNAKTLKHLVDVFQNSRKFGSHPRSEALTVLTPLMNCTTSEYYSNFWGAMDDRGYYKRSDNYFDLQKRRLQGVFPVAMVHSVYMIDLRQSVSEQLTYSPPADQYDGPIDDLIIFAKTAHAAGIQFFLDNTEFNGYFPQPVEAADLPSGGTSIEEWLNKEKELFTHLRLQAVIDLEDSIRVTASEYLESFANDNLPSPSKLGFDEIFYINLDRREDRRAKMEYFLQQLGIDAVRLPAVDGRALTPEQLSRMGIKQLKGYFDPYHKRSLKMGEIGCFLSHYKLWKLMIERGWEKILILEDDVRFAPSFVEELAQVQAEANHYVPDWDLIYIGRKRMSQKEQRVPGCSKLAYPDYTYWTLGYMLKRSGAEKLLNQKPLGKMVAVDEYLPIMFNRHPKEDWLEAFEPRNLSALSAEPLLLEPQRYTGEKFYVSDTEDSNILEVQ